MPARALLGATGENRLARGAHQTVDLDPLRTQSRLELAQPAHTLAGRRVEDARPTPNGVEPLRQAMAEVPHLALGRLEAREPLVDRKR